MNITIRRKKLKSGDESLYLDIYHNGKRHYEFLNIRLSKDKQARKEALALAEQVKAKRLIDLQSSSHGIIANFKKRANFLDYLAKIGATKKTNHNIWNATHTYLSQFSKNFLASSAIDEALVDEFKKYLLTKVSQNSAMVYFQTFRTALNQAVKDKLILSSPANFVTGIKFKEVEKSCLTMSEIEILAMTPCKYPVVKKAFLFCCYTGLRFSDVSRLTWANMKNDRIEFRQRKTGAFEYMPLSQMAKKLSDPQGNIIPMKNKKVFELPSHTYVNDMLALWSKRSGIEKKITFHTSRHTFATLMLTQGTSMRTVQKLLGHKSIKTTEVYAKIVDSVKQEAVSNLPMIEVS